MNFKTTSGVLAVLLTLVGVGFYVQSNNKTTKQIATNEMRQCVKEAQIMIPVLRQNGEDPSFWESELKRCTAALAAKSPGQPGSAPGEGKENDLFSQK